jgi:hypothetical protein
VKVNAKTTTADLVISDLVVSTTGAPASSMLPSALYREPCGFGLVFRIIGIGVFMAYKRRSNNSGKCHQQVFHPC